MANPATPPITAPPGPPTIAPVEAPVMAPLNAPDRLKSFGMSCSAPALTSRNPCMDLPQPGPFGPGAPGQCDCALTLNSRSEVRTPFGSLGGLGAAIRLGLPL